MEILVRRELLLCWDRGVLICLGHSRSIRPMIHCVA